MSDETEQLEQLESVEPKREFTQSEYIQLEQLESVALEHDSEIESGETAKNIEQMPDTADILRPAIEVAATILAPNWNIQKEEIDGLSDAYAGLIDKYFPQGLGSHSVEITALMVTAAVVMPRMKMPRKLEQRAESGGAEKMEMSDEGLA